MKIKSLFDDVEDVEINRFLIKCGVSNPVQYLTGQIVETYEHYDNIEECAEEIIKFIKKEGDANVN